MTDKTKLRRPPLDPELAAVVDVYQLPTVTAEVIPAMRQAVWPGPTLSEILEQANLEVRDIVIPGYGGDGITVSVIQAKGRIGRGPVFYHTHGGGMVMGDRFVSLSYFTEWLHRYNAVLVTVEYRLAPEFPDPVPVEDCYAGLVWMVEHADELGIDNDRVIIVGGSAGGGLTAGTALLARDRNGPKLFAQLLMCPMLDDRDQTLSTRQMDGVGGWDRASNITGWTALLGDRKGTQDVSIYAAPARATDLQGLAQTYVDVGTAEVFRDEAIAFASAIWEAGGQAELHVWPGGFHGYEAYAPQAAISRDTMAARDNWIRRILG